MVITIIFSQMCNQQEQEEVQEEVEESVVVTHEQVSLCMDCGMIIQTEQGLLNHQKFCKQVCFT